MESNLRTRVLVRALKELREQAGLTQEQAGKRLQLDNRKMSRIERGQLPNFHEMHAMLDLYGVPVNDWSTYDTQWRQAKAKGWWRTYGLDDRGYVPLESEAVSIKSFKMGLIPGLLQCRSYAEALFDGARQPGALITKGWAIREQRQRRLTADEPLVLHALVDHSVLTRRHPAMQDQLAHLVMLAELENITLQVVPDSRGIHVGLVGSFTILEFADAEIAYVEHVAGSVQLERDDEIRACRVAFEELRSIALGPEDSVALIDRMASEH